MPRTVLAAGTIPWRLTGSTLEVLLVHRPKYDDWSWPKGKLDRGETLAQCAVRETAEETGLQVRLGQPLGTVRYTMNDGARKVTSMWAAQLLDDCSPALLAREAVHPATASEIDGSQWLPAREAMKKLTYQMDREPLGHLVDQHDDARLRTSTVVILRHGRAMKRSAWRRGKGPEETRPLTATGQGQATRAVAVLAAYGIEDVMSSPWERCVATVRPYLELTGLGGELRGELTEAAHEAAHKPVRKTVAKVLAAAEVPTVICTHRPVLPTVIETIADVTPNRLRKSLPSKDPWLKTGEMLVAHVAPRRKNKAVVVAVERVRP